MSRFVLILLSLTAGFCAAGSLTDEQILAMVRDRAKALEEVTTKPVLMHANMSQLCRPPLPKEVAEEKANPHLEKYSRLYVNKEGRSAAEGHEPVHAEGSVLIKEKLPAMEGHATANEREERKAAKSPELFTGMLKREKGFNPDCGDWEFFTVSGDGTKMTARGKLTNCMECHQRYADRDFTSRKLVPERLVKAGSDGGLTLSARDASVLGNKLRCDTAANVLTAWSEGGDAATWELDIPAGRYTVEVSLACAAESAGAEVSLQLGHPLMTKPAHEMKFKVEGTGGSGDFKTVTAGSFEIPGDRRWMLKAVALSKPGAVVMDLKQIVIRPAGRGKAGQ